MSSLMTDRKELSQQKRQLQEKLGEGPFSKVRERSLADIISTTAKSFVDFTEYLVRMFCEDSYFASDLKMCIGLCFGLSVFVVAFFFGGGICFGCC